MRTRNVSRGTAGSVFHAVGEDWTTVQQIMRSTPFSKVTVRAALKYLLETGAIEKRDTRKVRPVFEYRKRRIQG